VDELFDDDPRGHQMNQSQKGLAQFLIPGRHAAKLCELVEEPFHLLASLIAVVVILSSGCPMALGWYHWPYVMGKALLANAMAVIALVRHRNARADVRADVERYLELRAVVDLATSQMEVERVAVEIGLEVDFGREAATRAAESLVLLPPCILPLPDAKHPAIVSMDGSPQPPSITVVICV